MNSHRMIGPYQVLEELGRGGMGAVFRARDPRDGSEVAVKVLLSDGGANERRHRRFAKEVEALQRLRHPSVVRVVDAGTHGHVPWLAMHFVPGETLAARLRTGGPLSVEQTLRLADDLGAGLNAAHAVGVLHRDVKPDNVLCEEATGRFLLTDFGLTRDVELAESRRLSLTGAIQGTPGFWAPEQAGSEETGPWTDVYGFGATLYAALTGRAPIEADSFVELLNATRDRAPEPLSAFRSDLPPAVARAILRSLAKAPADRFDSVAAMQDALATLEVPTSRLPRALALATVLLTGVLVAAIAATRSVTPEPAAGASVTPASPSVAPVESPTSTGARSPSPTATPTTRWAEGKWVLAGQVRELHRTGRVVELVRLLDQASSAGDPDAAYALALLYTEGTSVPQDRAKALALLRAAASGGVPSAFAQLGRFHMDGLGGLKVDRAAAVPFLKRAADEGVASAMVNLGTLHLQGWGGLTPDPTQALALYRQAAEQGSASACTRVGHLYAGGRGIPADLEAAARWFRKAADLGDKDGTFFLGELYGAGRGVPREPKRAVELYERAAKLGQGEAGYRLGVLYARGVVVSPQPGASAGWFLRGARSGNPRAMYAVSQLYSGGSLPQDPRAAAEWLQRAARAGHPRALLDVGLLLARKGRRAQALDHVRRARAGFTAAPNEGEALLGLGVLALSGLLRAKDPKLAAEYFLKAAQAGDPEAMTDLATTLQRGEGVERNLPLRLRWLERASKLGHAPAMERYALALHGGEGGPKDVPGALLWMRKCAERGWQGGMYGLGVMLESAAPGRKRDPAGAIEWYTKAATRMHVGAMVRLSVLHAGLVGDPPNPEEARRWYKRARAQVRPDQAKLLRVLKVVERALPGLKRSP